MEILTFILVVILLINSLSIKKQISELKGNEKKPEPIIVPQPEMVQNSGQTLAERVAYTGDVPEETQQVAGEVPMEAAPTTEVQPPQSYEPSEPTIVDIKLKEFFAWFKEDWLAKSGALILLIGIGWFVSYAFAEGWVGPQGRIAIGLIFGAVMLVFGYVLMRKSTLQGGLFLIIGSSTILTTVWAARTLYDMFSPLIALTIMFLSVVFVSVVAVLYKRQSLATVALVLALIAPSLTHSQHLTFGEISSYLLIVAIGTVWIVVRTGWKSLILISLAGVFLYGFPYSISVSNDIAGVALLYAFIFSGLFTIVANRTLMRSGKPPTRIDLAIVGGVGLYLLTWIQAAAPAHWESLLYAAWAIAFAGIGYVVFRITKDVKNFLVYAGIGLVYIVLATVATFEGPLLTIAFSIEATLIPVLVYMFTRRKNLLVNFSILQLGPILLSLESFIARGWNNGVPLDHFAVLLVLGCSLFGLGLYTYSRGKELEDDSVVHWGLGTILIGSLYFFALIWLVPKGIFSPHVDVGRLVSLVIYTVIGVITYIVGHMKENIPTRFAGGIIAGLVIVRLLLVEVWDMQVSTRIVTFLLVGGLLIATAFIEKKNKD